MTKNDLFFKILFAIQIALLPIVVATTLISSLPVWATSIALAGVLLAKIWVEVFKDKQNFTHKIMCYIGSVITFAVLLIFLEMKGVIDLWIAILAIVLITLHSAFNIILKKKVMPETIEAIDYCFVLFEILTLIAFTFAFYNITMTNIGLFAIILSTAVSVAYKVYYCIKFRVFHK